MKKLFLFKNDRYRKARGGYSRLLDITCAKCGTHVCFYQKDGPGILKRMYLDRIFESEHQTAKNNSPTNKSPLVCLKCKEILGLPMNYKKENRPAFRLFTGTITKKIVKNINRH